MIDKEPQYGIPIFAPDQDNFSPSRQLVNWSEVRDGLTRVAFLRNPATGKPFSMQPSLRIAAGVTFAAGLAGAWVALEMAGDQSGAPLPQTHLVEACGGPCPTDTPTPKATATKTAVLPTETPTPVKPTFTPTLEKPTATPTLVKPTATSTRVPATATATMAPVPTETPGPPVNPTPTNTPETVVPGPSPTTPPVVGQPPGGGGPGPEATATPIPSIELSVCVDQAGNTKTFDTLVDFINWYMQNVDSRRFMVNVEGKMVARTAEEVVSEGLTDVAMESLLHEVYIAKCTVPTPTPAPTATSTVTPVIPANTPTQPEATNTPTPVRTSTPPPATSTPPPAPLPPVQIPPVQLPLVVGSMVPGGIESLPMLIAGAVAVGSRFWGKRRR